MYSGCGETWANLNVKFGEIGTQTNKSGPSKLCILSFLQEIPLEEVKTLCLTELEGMSKKRIRYILAGKNELGPKFSLRS